MGVTLRDLFILESDVREEHYVTINGERMRWNQAIEKYSFAYVMGFEVLSLATDKDGNEYPIYTIRLHPKSMYYPL